MSTIPTCAVRAVVRDSVGGQPVAGAKVSARLSTYEVYQGYVVPHLVQATTDANGECVLDLWPNQLGAVESNYAVTIVALGKTLRTFCVVPSAPTAQLADIAGLPAYDGQPDGAFIIGQALQAVTDARAARDVAIVKAGEANTSATNAVASESNAAVSQANAATSETHALASKNSAQAWAVQLPGPVEGGEYSSKYHALAAAASAASIADGPVYSWIGLFGTITLAQARAALNITNVANLAPANYPVSTATQTALDGKVSTTTYTAGMLLKADLVGGTVPANQLPSFVDDVLEFANLAAFPAGGETGKIYIAINGAIPANPTRQYRWSGSAYSEINASPGTTDALVEGSTNLYFTQVRVLVTPFVGLSLATGGPITSSDNVLTAAGKLQKQLTDLTATVAMKSETVTTVTKDTASGAALIPAGTTAQRPANGAGKLRFNTDSGLAEINTGAAWNNFGGVATAFQIGTSLTASQNFTLGVPTSPDGTMKLARGLPGATTQDIFVVDAAGKMTMPSVNRRSRRNRVLNSNFCRNTRKKAGSVTLAAGAYGFDMWKAGAAGCTYTFATAGLDTTITITAGSLVQVIIGEKVVGGDYVMSWAGTSQGKIGAGTAAASGVTASSVAAATTLPIEFGTGTLGLVTLEEGLFANPYDRKDVDEEIHDLGYFLDTSYVGVAPGTLAAAEGRLTRLSSSTSAYVEFDIVFTRRMWKKPTTFNLYSYAGGEIDSIYNEASGAVYAAANVGSNNTSPRGGQFQAATAPTASTVCSAHFFASCEP